MTERSPEERHIETARTARYYTLGDAARAERCWVVCHGFSQLAGRFVRYFAALAERPALVLAPEALNRYYLEPGVKPHGRESPVGATWMTRVDRDAEIRDYVRYLDAVAVEAAAGLPLVALGFSQGAATAARWALRGGSRVEALVLWGSPLPHDLTREDAARLAGLRLIHVRGATDPALSAERVEQDRRRLEELGADVAAEEVVHDGGHRIERDALERVADLLDVTRPARPPDSGSPAAGRAP